MDNAPDNGPPKDTLEVLQKIAYEESLGPGDPRYVDTREARGSQRTLERLAHKFGLRLSDGRFFVVEIDVTADLDRNNVQYADIAMAMARALIARLKGIDSRIVLKPETFEDLERWFDERVKEEDKVREFVAGDQDGRRGRRGDTPALQAVRPVQLRLQEQRDLQGRAAPGRAKHLQPVPGRLQPLPA